MSYILDALKKSEQARGSRKTRVLLEEPFEMPVAPSQPRRSFRRWLLLITIILFFNTGFFVLWLRHWQSPAPSPILLSEQPKTGAHAGTKLREEPGAVENPNTAKPGVDAPRVAEREDHGRASGANARTGYGNSPVQPSTSVIQPPPVAQLHEKNEEVESHPVEKETSALSPPATEKPTASSAEAPLSGTQTHETVGEQAVENNPVKDPKEAAQSVKTEPAHRDRAPAPLPLKTSGATREVDAAVKKTDALKPSPTTKASGATTNLNTSNLKMARKPVEQPSRPAAASGIISDIQPLAELGPSAGKPAVAREKKWHELAPQIRDAIPKMSVSMLIYSKTPGNRWANINGFKRREGEEISAGLKLEEITPEGAIFNYQGHRFYKGVLGDN